MKIIKRREPQEEVSYQMCWWNDRKTAGYSFDCDEKGYVDVSKFMPAGQTSYQDCLAGKDPDLFGPVLERRVRRFIMPAVGICERCGTEVALTRDISSCECGADYGMSGQLMAPRYQWGEETGETWQDIVMARC